MRDGRVFIDDLPFSVYSEVLKCVDCRVGVSVVWVCDEHVGLLEDVGCDVRG